MMLDNLDIRINWILTLWINLTKLPLRYGWKLPILIYGWRSEIVVNKIILDLPIEQIKFGIVKIGCMFDVCTWTHYGAIIHSKGDIIFKGSCVIGRGISYWGGRKSIIEIGRNSVINGRCSIHCKEKILIGENLSCAWNVTINDTDFHPCRDMDTDILYSMSAPIIIGNNVWIGQNSTITKGSIISDWTVVGQLALTNKKYNSEPYTVLMGSPSRIIPNKHIRREDMYERYKYSNDYQITKGFKLFNIVESQ